MSQAGPRSLIGGEFETGEPLSLGSRQRLLELTKGLEGSWVASGRAAMAEILKRLKEKGAKRVLLC